MTKDGGQLEAIRNRSILLEFYCHIGDEWIALTKKELLQQFCDYLARRAGTVNGLPAPRNRVGRVTARLSRPCFVLRVKSNQQQRRRRNG